MIEYLFYLKINKKPLLCLEEKYKNTNTHKTKFHCFFFTRFNKNLFKFLHLLISSDFFQYVVIINVINYPELFCPSQFTHG